MFIINIFQRTEELVLYFHKYGKFVVGQWIWTQNGGKH